MQTSLLVSIVGPDRPGLVEQLSRVVTDAGGNWEGSRLIQLGGQFAGIVQVIAPEGSIATLSENLEQLSDAGLTVSVIHSGESSTSDAPRGQVETLEVVGQDRSGIVAAISETMAKENVNVIELATDCLEAPWSGERLFHTTATVALPEGLSIEYLIRKIEEIAGDLMVELQKESG
jgi:glycine cleavage system regulatory protein